MKTAIYIEDGTVQLVITPENKFEKNALDTFREKNLTVRILAGSFYETQGGYIRNGFYDANHHGDDRSLILRIDEKPPVIHKCECGVAIGESYTHCDIYPRCIEVSTQTKEKINVV